MLRFDQIGMVSLQLFQLHPEEYPLKFRPDWLPSRSELNSLEFELHLISVRDALDSSLHQVLEEELQWDPIMTHNFYPSLCGLPRLCLEVREDLQLWEKEVVPYLHKEFERIQSFQPKQMEEEVEKLQEKVSCWFDKVKQQGLYLKEWEQVLLQP